jgi:hypothetical protein
VAALEAVNYCFGDVIDNYETKVFVQQMGERFFIHFIIVRIVSSRNLDGSEGLKRDKFSLKLTIFCQST